MQHAPFTLSGRAAIVTGGANGIGFGIVDRFVEAGADVVLADLDLEAAQRAAGKLSGPGRIIAVDADVADPGCGQLLVSSCIEAFGRIDILVNNAGIYPQRPFASMTPELLDRVLGVNLRGLVFVTQQVTGWMIANEVAGKIINISSIDAFRPSMPGLSAYDASKGAVGMLTKSLALELAPHRISVNAIAPGGIATEGTSAPLEGSGMTAAQLEEMMRAFLARIPLGRMGVPDDIGKVALFLASSGSDYMTGTTIIVDGGALLT